MRSGLHEEPGSSGTSAKLKTIVARACSTRYVECKHTATRLLYLLGDLREMKGHSDEVRLWHSVHESALPRLLLCQRQGVAALRGG
eukprot:scaffold241_cov242-Pinguiococcus_pyrenoidosus.AAC.34